MLEDLLRTFAQKISNIDFFRDFYHLKFMGYLCQKCKKKWGSPTSFRREQAWKITLNLKNRASLANKATMSVKAMLHEATCNATVTNKKPFKLQKRCHTLATFFATCNAYNNKQDGGNLLRVKDELWMQLQYGVLHVTFFLQLTTQCLLHCKLQEKLLRVTWT